MTVRKQWIQAATVAVDEETGALLVLPAGLSNADRVELKPALPDAEGAVAIPLGKTVHTLLLSVPAGVQPGEVTYSLKGAATTSSPDLDGSMFPREESPEGVSTLYLWVSKNMSAYTISIRGWAR